METKEYYQAFISIIDYVNNGNNIITCEKGEELAGNYWPRIYEVLYEKRIGTAISGGEFIVTQSQYLSPIYEDCLHAIKETLNPQLHSRSATYIKRNGLLIRKITIKSSRPFQCAYHPLTP